MKTVSELKQGTAARSAAVLGLSFALCTAGAHALEPALQATLSEPKLEAKAGPVGGWFQQLFNSSTTDPKKLASEQIEAMGLSVDANSCIRAVAVKNRRLVDLFIRSGFDLNARGDQGRTALLAAALQKDWGLAEALLKAGANPNVADDAGATPLMAAALVKEAAPLQMLLKAGAKAELVDANGHSALHYAVDAVNVSAVPLLLKAGAKVDGPCCEGHDLASHALETKKKEIVVPVLQAHPGNLSWNSEARALLTGAITAKDAEYTKLFLTKFAGAPTPEDKAQPLLAYALLENDLEKFKYLLSCGADPDTALNSPVEKSFSAQVTSNFTKSYLDNETGMTTLMLAAGLGKMDFAKALLDAGCKRNQLTGKYKMAAVYFAARAEKPEMLQLLIGNCPKPEEMRIEISLGSQRAYLFKNGSSVFSTPISSGRTGFSTPTGQFVITDKHVNHRSTLYPADMPYFMRLSYRDFGMHIGALPGYPASHGCIRLPSGAAKQLYKDVPVGTLVSITQ